MKNTKYTDELQMLLSEVDNYKVLDAKTQKELVIKAQNGSEKAKEDLLMSNMKFIISFISKYEQTGLDTSELISEASIGLIEAIDKYDVNKDINFLTYAVWWIKHNVESFIHKSAKAVKIPTNKTRLVHDLKRQETILQNEGHRENEIVEIIAQDMNMSTSEVIELIGTSQEDVSLNNTMNDEVGMSFIEYLEDKNNVDINTQVVYLEEQEYMKIFFNKIPQREAAVISERYGMSGEVKTLVEISKTMGLTKERVRQIEKRGITRMIDLKEKAFHSLDVNKQVALAA